MRRYTVIVRDTLSGDEREFMIRANNVDAAIAKAIGRRKTLVVVWIDVD